MAKAAARMSRSASLPDLAEAAGGAEGGAAGRAADAGLAGGPAPTGAAAGAAPPAAGAAPGWPPGGDEPLFVMAARSAREPRGLRAPIRRDEELRVGESRKPRPPAAARPARARRGPPSRRR